MVKSFKCMDMGKNCDWSAKANSTYELMEKITEHANSIHNVKQIPVVRKAKIASSIKDDQII